MAFFQITCSAEVARTGSGVRRRTLTLEDGERRLVEFSRAPVIVNQVPPEIADDPHLIVREINDVGETPVLKLAGASRAQKPDGAGKKGTAK